MPEASEIVWRWSRATLHRFMKNNGFIYRDQVTHYEYTKSREDIVLMSDNYLEWISNYRFKGYNIFYQDETWVLKSIAPTKVWQDTTGNSTEDLPNKPSGSCERSILSHVFSETFGLLDDCF